MCKIRKVCPNCYIKKIRLKQNYSDKFIIIIKKSVLNKHVVFPKTCNCFSLVRIKCSFSLNGVKNKIPLKYFTICESELTFSMLWVILKITLIIYPFLSQISEVLIIKRINQFIRSIIENSAKSTKLIIFPIALVCNLAILVV